MKLNILLILLLSASNLTFSQDESDKWELPDFICKDYNLRYITASNTGHYSFKLKLKKIVSGEIIIQSRIRALAGEVLTLKENEYLLLAEKNRKYYIFTLYDPEINKEWSFSVKASDESQALWKYQHKIRRVINTIENKPKERTGKDLSHPFIKKLLQLKPRQYQGLFVYFTKDDFDKDSSQFIGEFIEHNLKSIDYHDHSEKKTTLQYKDIYRFTINGKNFIPISMGINNHLVVTPIGYREKYFYINAGAILNKISGSPNAYKTYTLVDLSLVHFVSDSRSSKIYKLNKLRGNNSGDLHKVFDCINQKKDKYSMQAKLNGRVKCVQNFLWNLY